jgi:hypothetical protein
MQYAKWYLPMGNNNLAAPQSKFGTSIFSFEKADITYSYSEGLLGVHIQN